MLDLFKIELETQSAVLGEGLLALERAPASATEIDTLMRAAHSIKGAARILQFGPLVDLAHVMEDVFVAVQENRLTLSPAHLDVLLTAADHFAQVAQQAEEAIPGWVESNAPALAEATAAVSRLREPGWATADAQPGQARAAARPSGEGTAPAGSAAAQERPPPESGRAAETAPGSPAAAPATVFGQAQEAPGAPAHERAGATPDLPSQDRPAAASGGAPAQAGEGPAAGPRPATPEPAEADRVLRVSAENLRRVVGLAGECLVETHNLAPLVDRFQSLRATQRELLGALDRWFTALPADLPPQARAEANRVRDTAKRFRSEFTDNLHSLESAAQRLDDNAERLFREVLLSRMRPFEEGTSDLARMVRDLARQLGKRVRFDLLGKDTRVDRDILDKLKAPLTHLVRNALDHGVEEPAARAAAGKPEEATLRVSASHRAGMLAVEVRDDGRGIDPQRLRARILERGLSDATTVAALSTAELHEFLFLPGFSTASAVTEVSGRGVGLDVVLSTVQEVSGTIRVDSELGRGTGFLLQLPVTRSVLRALLVEVDGEPYAIPLARLDQALRVPRQEVLAVENRSFIALDGQNVGLVSGRLLLGRATGRHGEELAVVVVSDRDARYGVVVDGFIGERTIVVHPLDRRLGKVRNISAASVMEDGAPLLIFDIDDLVRSADAAVNHERPVRAAAAAREQLDLARKRVLVVDDSLTVRELERRLLEGRGYQVDVAVNGMDGWNAVREGHYDLVVTDVDMPRMNGIQLVELIKGDARLARTPVVIVSYKDRPEDRAAGLEAGADYYLTKSSFQDEAILKVVEDLIGAP